MKSLFKTLHHLFVVLIAFVMIVQTSYPGMAADKSQSERRDQYLSLKAKLAPLDRIFKYVSDQVDRSVFEVPALAGKLGPDPRDAFEFVRDRIGYRAYYGSLRGADGVLVDRVGNSLDRALLLAAILSTNKHEVRIAQASLDDVEAEQLARRTFEPQPETPPVIELTPVLMSVFLNEGKLKPGDVRNVIAKQKIEAKSFSTDLSEIVKPAFSELQTAIEKSDLKLPDPPGIEQLTEEAREHYWVQLKTAGGKWINLDPSLQTSLVNDERLTPERTFSPISIPDELRHRLRIQVVLSVNEQDRIVEKIVIDEVLNASENVGKSIALSSFPLNDKKNLLTAGSSKRVAYKRSETLAVALQLKGKPVAMQLFNLKGELLQKPPEVADKVKSGFGNALSALDQISAPNDQETSQPDNQLVGMRVLYSQIDSQGLGQEPKYRSSERVYLSDTEVVDWTPENGAVTRPANLSSEEISSSISWMTEVAMLPATLTANYAAYKQLSFLGSTSKYLDFAMRKVFDLPADTNSTLPGGLLPWQLYSLAAAANANMTDLDPNQSSWVQVARYSNRTTLLALEMRIDNSTQSLVSTEFMTDIVSLGDRLVIGAPDAATIVNRMRLQLGVEWTALERLVAEQRRIDLDHTVRPIKNLTRTLSSTRADSIGLSVIAPGNSLEISKLAIPAILKNELGNSGQFSAGLIVPSRSKIGKDVGFGWWALDYDTGIPIGRLPGGRGGNAEYKALAGAMSKTIFLSIVTGRCLFDGKSRSIHDNTNQILCFAGFLTGLAGGVGFMIVEGVTAVSTTIALGGASLGLFIAAENE